MADRVTRQSAIGGKSLGHNRRTRRRPAGFPRGLRPLVRDAVALGLAHTTSAMAAFSRMPVDSSASTFRNEQS